MKLWESLETLGQVINIQTRLIEKMIHQGNENRERLIRIEKALEADDE